MSANKNSEPGQVSDGKATASGNRPESEVLSQTGDRQELRAGAGHTANAVLGYHIKHGDFRHYSGATVPAQSRVQQEAPNLGYYEGCADLVITPLVAADETPSSSGDETRRGMVRAAVADNMTALYVCSRQASAWADGTMRLDDFSPARASDDAIYNITEAVMGAIDNFDSSAVPVSSPTQAMPSLNNLPVHYVEGLENGGYYLCTDVIRAFGRQDQAPINMILHCPDCHLQHIDAPDFEDDPSMLAAGIIYKVYDGWTNPTHRSHLCRACGCIWRPADVPTNGVASIATAGKADTPNQLYKQSHILKFTLDLYDYLDSVCPKGMADEAYTIAPEAVRAALAARAASPSYNVGFSPAHSQEAGQTVDVPMSAPAVAKPAGLLGVQQLSDLVDRAWALPGSVSTRSWELTPIQLAWIIGQAIRSAVGDIAQARPSEVANLSSIERVFFVQDVGSICPSPDGDYVKFADVEALLAPVLGGDMSTANHG